MKSTLRDIQNNFSIHKYLGMESLRQTVVARLLAALGWDIWNPREIRRDFQPLADSQMKLDFTLWLENGLPPVFVKIVPMDQMKNIQLVESIVKLSRRYNGSFTACFFIITDGAIWEFYEITTDYYSPANCFARLNLLKDDHLLLEVTFRKFLQRSAVESGMAHIDARSEHGLPSQTEPEVPSPSEVPLGSTYENPHVLRPSSPNDFTYTEILDGRFAGTRCFNWNELIRYAIGFAYKMGTPYSELRNFGILHLENPQKNSFYPISGTNLWLQTMDAKHAWSRTLAIAKQLNVEVSVHFRWQNVVGLPRQHQYGLLAWKPDKM